jgi:hypothetical protein
MIRNGVSKMKKCILLFSVLAIFLALPLSRTEAADIWVDHWDDDNVDIYMMEDTLSGSSDHYSFSVSTKMVTNGRLKEVITWNYGKGINGMWRYRTNTMRGDHTTVVSVHNPLFEYCMNYLGWPYEIRNDMYYY